MNTRLLIVGATSAIATAVARRYSKAGARLYLIARREGALNALADDLRVRGATEVVTATLDANDISHHASVVDSAWKTWDGFDRALIAHGVLPNQLECENDVNATLAAFDTNARSVIALGSLVANRLESQGAGALGFISSPAGDRGRKSNYVYGAGKAAVSVFAAGLRHRLASKGVRVITILPGFVDTPMTQTFTKGALWVSADRVASDIVQALERGFGTVYTPWFWRGIMAVIRHVPERIFVKTSL